MKDKILIAYFKQKGVDNSTCQKIANDISTGLLEKEYSSVEYAITPVEIYPTDKTMFENVVKMEKDRRYRPTLTGKVGKFHEYATIVLVAPNWYNDLPMAVYSFFDEHDFAGTRVVPVICHGGDGSKEIVNTLRHYLHKCDVLDGIEVADSAFDAKPVAQAVKEILSK